MTFEFVVCSNRLGHDDVYRIERTQNGWNIRLSMEGVTVTKPALPICLNFSITIIFNIQAV
jgi:hypothetical protein